VNYSYDTRYTEPRDSRRLHRRRRYGSELHLRRVHVRKGALMSGVKHRGAHDERIQSARSYCEQAKKINALVFASTTFDYDRQGNVASTTYPNGRQVLFGYDLGAVSPISRQGLPVGRGAPFSRARIMRRTVNPRCAPMATGSRCHLDKTRTSCTGFLPLALRAESKTSGTRTTRPATF
jgi:YD repeat-containing protein